MKRVFLFFLIFLFLVSLSDAKIIEFSLKAGPSLAFDNETKYLGLSLDFLKIVDFVYVGADIMIGKGRTYNWKEDVDPWFKKRYKNYQYGFIGISIKGLFFDHIAFPIIGYNTDDKIYIGIGFRF